MNLSLSATRLVRKLTTWLLSALLCVFTAQAIATTCEGKFPNFLTDICWSCVGPIKVGGSAIAMKDQDDTNTVSGFGCMCTDGPTVKIGTKVSFWEPSRIAEVVKTPYCFPTLGGTQLDLGVNAPGHYRDPQAKEGTKASFYQVHWYVSPLMYLTQFLMDSSCIDKQGFDLAYMTELDPLWADSESTFILNPDASLFTNLAAKAACTADCVAASAGFPLNSLFWCAGCQGSMYPLTGWVGSHVSAIQASSLLTQRITNKLHREGLMWSASGSESMCSYTFQPIMDKTNYKTQMIYPVASTNKVFGKCCNPYGRTTVHWQSGKEIPYRGGENFSYQIYRKRDCCQGAF